MKLLALILLASLCIVPYIWNGYKLSACDFESNYKCEVVHGIGVILPPAAFVTVWFDTDSE